MGQVDSNDGVKKLWTHFMMKSQNLPFASVVFVSKVVSTALKVVSAVR
jgi:hypothetical protein